MRYFLELMVPSVVAVMAATGLAFGIAGASWQKAIWAGVIVLTISVTVGVVLTVMGAIMRKHAVQEVADNYPKGGDQS